MNLVNKFVSLEEKGDYINFCLKYNKDIKDIDVAVEHSIIRVLKDLNVCKCNLVTVYWENGQVEICNIVAMTNRIARM